MKSVRIAEMYLISHGITRYQLTWWRHQIETFSALLALCAGNSPASGEFPTQRPVTWSFDIFFDLGLNKRLSKQSWGWWLETLSSPLWRHRNEPKSFLHWLLLGGLWDSSKVIQFDCRTVMFFLPHQTSDICLLQTLLFFRVMPHTMKQILWYAYCIISHLGATERFNILNRFSFVSPRCIVLYGRQFMERRLIFRTDMCHCSGLQTQGLK